MNNISEMKIEDIRLNYAKLIVEGKKKEAFIYGCQNDLRYLCRDVLGMKDWDIIHDELFCWYKDNQENKRKLLLIPRGHLKSSIITIGATIQKFLNNPNIRILIAHAIWDHSRGFIKKMESYLTEFSELSKYFGDFKPRTKDSQWNKDAFAIKQRTVPSVEATVTATGVERTQAGQHYDYIIFDDVVERENITTKEQREKIKQFYKDCLSLLDPGGEICVIGTTWHEDDLYNDLRKNDEFTIYVRQAIENGNIIFPKKFNQKILDGLKKELGIYTFSSQYMLDPYPDEDMEFKRHWIKTYDVLPKKPMFVSLTLDPSLGKIKSDASGLTVTGVTAEGIKYVIIAKRFKTQVERLGLEIIKVVQELSYDGITVNMIGIESFGFQQSIEPQLRAEIRKMGINLNFEMMPTSTVESKEDRILAMIPDFCNGDVYIKPDMIDLKDELLRFRKNRKNQRDDIIDALSYQRKYYWSRKPSITNDTSYKPGTFGYIMQELNTSNKLDLFDEFKGSCGDNFV